MNSREFSTGVNIPTWNDLASKMEKCGIPDFLVNKNLQTERGVKSLFEIILNIPICYKVKLRHYARSYAKTPPS